MLVDFSLLNLLYIACTPIGGGIFLLPKGVVHIVKQLCRDFLWTGSYGQHIKAKVAWKQVCKPKSGGGLGLQHLASFNKCLLLKNLWSLILKKDSLWVRWVHGFYLRGVSFWDTDSKPHFSWVFKNILKLRQDALLCLSFANDSIQWSGPSPEFSSSATYQVLMGDIERKNWFHVVWNKFSIPRHIFVFWLACQDRLPTRTRLQKIGVLEDNSCGLCGVMIECRDHLFFQCSFSMQVWELVMAFVQVTNPPCRWQELIPWTISAWKGSRSIRGIKRAAVAACVYYIWKARNMLIFQEKTPCIDDIYQQIIFEVKIQCSRIVRMKNSGANRRWCKAMSIYPEFEGSA